MEPDRLPALIPLSDSAKSYLHPGPLRALTVWLFVAAAAQLFYLTAWPMYIAGVQIDRYPAFGVALVRMALYTGLAQGLRLGQPIAWAGTFAELARSLVFFALHAFPGDRLLSGAMYPASWAQGLLSAGVPVMVLYNTVISFGWNPGPDAEMRIAFWARIFAVTGGAGALWLRRHFMLFGLTRSEHVSRLFRDGLPVLLVLTAVEGAAVWLSLR
jgi:hypothetical protein